MLFAASRSLLVVAVCLVGAMAACPSSFAEEAVSLFNGTSLDGWEGKTEFWSVQDGAIVGLTTKEKPTKGNTFLIYRKAPVGDFELDLDYRITGGNSGIQYRSKDMGDSVVGGYQADFEAGAGFSGILYEERGRGILTKRGERTMIATDGKKMAGEPIGNAAELQKVIKPGEWNHYRIVAHGPKLSHFINGQLMSETVDEQEGKRAVEGILALQLHAGPPMKVEFKDIKLKKLPPAGK